VVEEYKDKIFQADLKQVVYRNGALLGDFQLTSSYK
jgi:hypothetical protein